MNNEKSLFDRIVYMELKALDRFCDYNKKDYVNPDVMGILDYLVYLDLYFEYFGECFECGKNPCDEGCPYQVIKGENNENTN